MSEMKLIMEGWREFEVITEASKINTVGDLKKVIKLLRAKETGGEIGKKAAGMLVGLLPGGATAMELLGGVQDAAGLFKKLFGAEDKYKTGTGLDVLNVDDDVSKIVDDPIEVAYLNYLIGDKFKSAPDNQSLGEFNATQGLQQFIASKFKGKTVTTGGGK